MLRSSSAVEGKGMGLPLGSSRSVAKSAVFRRMCFHSRMQRSKERLKGGLCAAFRGAEEFITAENPAQPLFRVTGIVITQLVQP